MAAIAALEPVTIFHEPINIRADNVERIAAHARTLGIETKSDVFASRTAWTAYAIDSLLMVSRVARELGVSDRLHLWPDKALGTKQVIATRADPEEYRRWLQECWSRISSWPRPPPRHVRLWRPAGIKKKTFGSDRGPAMVLMSLELRRDVSEWW